eukprot:sb/3476192/
MTCVIVGLGYKQNRNHLQSPEGTKTRKTISQSTSGDFTGSSRCSPVGEYQSNYTSVNASYISRQNSYEYTPGTYSNFTSEPVSRSYTPSQYTASYTPSDASDAINWLMNWIVISIISWR